MSGPGPSKAWMIAFWTALMVGWNPSSLMYIVLWVYFVLYIILAHFYVLNEEKVNIQKFGQEYRDYIKRVPRYFLLK